MRNYPLGGHTRGTQTPLFAIPALGKINAQLLTNVMMIRRLRYESLINIIQYYRKSQDIYGKIEKSGQGALNPGAPRTENEGGDTMHNQPTKEIPGETTETHTIRTATNITPQGSKTRAPKRTLMTRVIGYLASILLAFLAFRFVLALLGANPINLFARFIYGVTAPFVTPFSGLFGYHLAYGVSQLEVGTLMAMATYLVAAWALTRLVNLIRI